MALQVRDPADIPAPLVERLRVWLRGRRDDGRRRTQEDLAHEARAFGAESMNGSYVSKVIRGARRPSAPNIAALAQAIGERPEDFPEYHLARIRQQLDERPIERGGAGFDVAVLTLWYLDDAVGGAGLSAALREIPRALTERASTAAARQSGAPRRGAPRTKGAQGGRR